MDYTIKIGGEAGQGIQTIGETLARVFTRSGFYVFSHQDYESRVRGGHNFFQVRLSDRPVVASRSQVDILIAFDSESVRRHAGELSTQGFVVYDSSLTKESYDGDQFLHIPFVEIALQSGGSKIMANTVATGAVLGMLGMELDIFSDVLAKTLKRKDEKTIGANMEAARAGMEIARNQCLRCAFEVQPVGNPRTLMGTNDAIGLGAIASGCKFYSAYPMTPSTGIMLYLAGKAKEYGIVVEQAEDEISAINMALGASFAGVRSMTGTSGGGFALMVEGLSLAAITETPIVIALAQRPGPATGLPTRTEQADLLFAVHAAHGEFPRVIFAPGSPEQAFVLTNRAFDISQRYQIPVFILTDQYLSDTLWNVENLDIEQILYHDYRVPGEEMGGLKAYKRHALSDDGISPFAIPGQSPHIVVTDSDEHDEEGHLTEEKHIRNAMVEKRFFRKMRAIQGEIDQPLHYGAEKPEVVLMGWGSTYGIMKEAVDMISSKAPVAMLHFSKVYPVPEGDYLGILTGAKRTISVEQNATSQFAHLLRAGTGFRVDRHITRYDGRPFTVEELVGEIDANLG